jgi:hypothetical protein
LIDKSEILSRNVSMTILKFTLLHICYSLLALVVVFFFQIFSRLEFFILLLFSVVIPAMLIAAILTIFRKDKKTFFKISPIFYLVLAVLNLAIFSDIFGLEYKYKFIFVLMNLVILNIFFIYQIIAITKNLAKN